MKLFSRDIENGSGRLGVFLMRFCQGENKIKKIIEITKRSDKSVVTISVIGGVDVSKPLSVLQFSISDESNELPDFPELNVGYGSSNADDDVDLLSSSMFSSFRNKFSSDVQMVEVDSLSHFFRLVCVDIDRFSRFDSLIFSMVWIGCCTGDGVFLS